MYDKARRGETVELSPRRISIFQFDIERSLDDRFYPFSSQCISNLRSWLGLTKHLSFLFLQTKSDFSGYML